MSNHPWPSQATLRTEELAGFILAEQARSVATFQDAVRTFGAAVDAIDFPLGSPIAGYDVADVVSQLSDWLIPTDAGRDTDVAFDLARDAA